MGFDLRFYLALLLGRLPYLLMIVVATTAAGIFLAYTLPPVYRAESKLLVESPQIPDELAASTVRTTAQEILVAIQQRLLARANLLDISDKFGLHTDTPEIAADDIVEDMRARILIDMPPFQGSTGVVSVSFDAPRPKLSADVTTTLVDQILEQNVALRTGAARRTLDFFQQETKRLAEEMAQQNAKILEFKEQNRNALPESLEYRRTRQSAQQERLLQVDRELAGLRDRRQRLSDLYDRTGRLAASLEDLSPEQARLEELRQELASALVIYSPQNPRVRALQTQVAALEQVVAEQLGAGGNEALTTFDLQMADIDGQIDFLAEQKALLERELTDIEASIEATPGNAIALGGLESDYENLRVQYDQTVASLAEAQMGDRIEVTARGQRISVIEPAAVPNAPAAPNRKLIVAAGFGAGLVLAGAVMFLIELLNSTVRRPAELVGALGLAPFATVPYMQTRGEIWRRRTTAWGLAAAIFLGPPLALYLIHHYVVPVDGFLISVAEKAGIGELAEQIFHGQRG